MKVLPRPVLMLVTEPTQNLAGIVAAAVEGGVNVVQLRGLPMSLETREAAREIRESIRGKALFAVNSLAGLAREIGADGVHLPESGPGIDAVRAEAGDRLIGRSIHSVESAWRAEEEGADYLIAGTIFASPSHPEAAPAGLDFLREVCAEVSIPVIAIGGIAPENAKACLEAGSAGIAVLSRIMRASDPRRAASTYWRALYSSADDAEARR